MRKLIGIVAVLLLLSGCTAFDVQARHAFERERAVDAAVTALQLRLEDVPGVEVATVGIRPATDLIDPDGEPATDDYVGAWVTMGDVDNASLVEVAALVRETVESGPLASFDHELIVQAGGREALRMVEFTITDDLLLEALAYWREVRALVDTALSLTIGHSGYGLDYSRILSAPPDTPQITAAYVRAFPQIVEIPDVTLGMPIVDLTGFRLVGELPPLPVMETFGRILPDVSLLSRDYNPRRQGHVMFEWRYNPYEKTGAIYNVHAIQETDSGEEDLETVVRELAATAIGPTTLRSYLVTRPGSVRFGCERAESPFADDLDLVEWLSDRDIPVTVEANAGYCA